MRRHFPEDYVLPSSALAALAKKKIVAARMFKRYHDSGRPHESVAGSTSPVFLDCFIHTQFVFMPKLFGSRLPGWMDRMAYWRAQKVIQHFPNNLQGLILDVGCGDGSVTKALSEKKGVTAWGVDVVNNFRYGLPFQRGDGRFLPYRDNSFDAVLLIYVLHHCTNIEEVLKECQRVCKGMIILQEDVSTNPWNRWVTHFLDYLGNTVLLGLLSILKRGGWQLMKVPYNFRKDNQWKECFRKMGLKLIEAKEISIGPFDPVPHRQYVIRVATGGFGEGPAL